MIYIYNLLFQYKNFLLAYSGGSDSSFLLYLLYKIKLIYYINIRVIHINHSLNNISIFWEKFCINQCKKYNISIIIERLFFLKKINSDIENNLREIRYSFFKKNIFSNEILLTAHHLNDNCENFFLRLKRGSFLNGLTSIKYIQYIKNFFILKPLLTLKKEEILLFIKKKKINFINDKSNLSSKFDRNFLRLEIFNKILNRWNFFDKIILKITNFLIIQNDILKKNIYKKLLICKTIFDLLLINKLFMFQFEYYIHILQLWLKLYFNILFSFNKIISLIDFINSKSQKLLKINNINFYYYKNKIFVIENKNKFNLNIWKIKFCFILPYNVGYFIPNKGNFYIRYPKKNEIISILFFFNLKNKYYLIFLLKLFNKLNISIYKRNFIPLIFYNKKLICVGDIYIIDKLNNYKNFFSFQWNKNFI